MNPEIDRQRAEKRRHLLAHVAGSVAAGIVTPPGARSAMTDVIGTGSITVVPPPPDVVASYAVAVARAILEEIEG